VRGPKAFIFYFLIIYFEKLDYESWTMEKAIFHGLTSWSMV
jgi:hypothetical protein